MLVVAVAANVAKSRPGWPVENPVPQLDVQGWLEGSVQVLEVVVEDTGVEEDSGEPVETGDSGEGGGVEDTAETDDEQGGWVSGQPRAEPEGPLCGCATPPDRSPSGGLAGLPLALVGLVGARRRASAGRAPRRSRGRADAR
jgi:hypothetical protein